jgi:hypothetical protein
LVLVALAETVEQAWRVQMAQTLYFLRMAQLH